MMRKVMGRKDLSRAGVAGKGSVVGQQVEGPRWAGNTMS